MKKSDAQTRVLELREQISQANREYYLEDNPTLTDAQYDALFDELTALETKFPDLLTPDSPTQTVGTMLPGTTDFAPVKHATPMLSLGKAQTEQEFRDWFGRVCKLLGRTDNIELTAEPKFDGLSIELVYRDGKLEVASTRGDGQVGEDVTPNVRTIKQIPHKIKTDKGVLEVRGEIYIPIDEFKKLNEKLAEQDRPTFSNPRNSAAGSLRQKDPEVTRSRPLFFAAHGLGLHPRLISNRTPPALRKSRSSAFP